MENKVVVEIFGEQYPLKTDEDAAYIQKLAAVVDEDMRTLARARGTLSGDKLGALAALQMADRYFRMKKDYDELVQFIDRKNRIASNH